MVIVIILLMYVLWKYAHVFKKDESWLAYFVLNFIVIFVLVYLHLIEINFFERDLFAFTDEIYYYRLARGSFSELSKITLDGRVLYGTLCWLQYNVDLNLNEYALKLLNIPIVLLILLQLYEIYPDRRIFYFSPLAIPYLYMMSAQCMRDPLIWCMALSCIKNYINLNKQSIFINKRTIINLTLSFIVLYILRPQAGIFILLSITLFVFFRQKGVHRVRNSIIMFCAIILFICICYPLLNRYYSITQHRMGYEYIESNISDDQDDYMHRQGYGSGVSTYKIATIGIVRQIITPIPTSKIKQLFIDKTPYMETNMYMIDISRIVQNTFLYYFFVYFLIYRKRLKNIFRSIPDEIKVYLGYTLLTTAAYAMYGYGGGSSRNKMEFTILIYLIYIVLSNKKTKGDVYKKQMVECKEKSEVC